ncbi:MAG: nucleotidyl transferase, partial [Actinomycetota bacterium]
DGVPLVDLAMARVAAHVQRLAVNAHHLAGQLADHVAGRAHLSLEQPDALGTAGALGLLRDWLDGSDVLVTNADAYLPGALDDLVAGFDGERCRLMVSDLDPGARGDFTRVGRPVRYVGACVLPWRLVSGLAASPSGLYEVLWRDLGASGRLDLAVTAGTVVDCGTPADYLRANLLASGGRSVVGAGAVVEGVLERCVVWDGAHVGPDEHLVDVVRAGDRSHPITVPAAAATAR